MTRHTPTAAVRPAWYPARVRFALEPSARLGWVTAALYAAQAAAFLAWHVASVTPAGFVSLALMLVALESRSLAVTWGHRPRYITPAGRARTGLVLAATVHTLVALDVAAGYLATGGPRVVVLAAVTTTWGMLAYLAARVAQAGLHAAVARATVPR